DGAEECFFERAPDRAVAGTIDNAEFYHLVLQQPQGPACASFGRLGTGQGNQLGLLLAVKNPSNGRHRARLAAQYGLEAFFHQLFAHPINHGWAGFQGFDDPVVAPPFASFRDIGLQQDPRLQHPARRALSFPNQCFKPFAFLAAQPHNILLYRNLLRSHDCLPRQSLATKANHQILSNWLKRATSRLGRNVKRRRLAAGLQPGVLADLRRRAEMICQGGARAMSNFTLRDLEKRVHERAKASAHASYTRRLLDQGVAHCAKKLGEEAIETVLAAVEEDRARLIAEAADLIYHLLVVLEARGISWADVEAKLAERTRQSGLTEKASRKGG